MMLNRANNLILILLLTLSNWGQCCCVSTACGSETTASSDHMAMTAHPKANNECGSKVDLALDCQGQWTPFASSTCDCFNHQNSDFDYFVFPAFKEISVSAPLIPRLFEWTEQIYAKEQAFGGIVWVIPVSNRFAPSLSVLARYLI